MRAMAGPWISTFYCGQGWASQFSTKMQNLGGFGLLSVCRHRAWYAAIACCPSTGILVGEHSAWGTLLFAAEKAAAAMKVIQDGRTTLLGGMTREAAKEALQSGM